MKYYIIWNEGKSEGIITNYKEDATYANTRVLKRGMIGVSSIVENFIEIYDETENFEIQEIVL